MPWEALARALSVIHEGAPVYIPTSINDLSNDITNKRTEQIDPTISSTDFDPVPSEESGAETETEYLRFGEQILSYKLKEEKFTSYFIHRVNQNISNDKKFINWFQDIEIYLEMVLPKSSTFNREGSAWIVCLVYEQYHVGHFQTGYAPIGFTKIYSSYAYPDKRQAKIR